MDPIDVFRQQSVDFEKYLPSWDARDSVSFTERYGDIVSAVVVRSAPDGAMLILASKTHTVGPMTLTQVAVDNLARLFAALSSNRVEFGGQR
jgi:hypothetical protein